MLTCPNCGHENAESDNYCSNCGAPLATATGAGSGQQGTSGTTAPGATGSESTRDTTGDAFSDSFNRRDSDTGTADQPATDTSSTTTGSTFGSSSSSQGSSQVPPPVDFRPTGTGPSVEEEWRMSNLGPPPKRRRTWLWVLVGFLALCILACVAFSVYINTDSGAEWWSDIQTEAAEQATQAAD